MVKSRRKREKRFRPEKIISERQFLNPELRRTKEDLPKEMMVYVPSKHSVEGVKEKSKPVVDPLTKKYLGSGKKPKWMDCPEEEVIEGDEEKEKKESQSSS